MIIPSIDIRNGEAVQMVEGREQALNAGDPMAVAEKFSVSGPMAVIDLDAAMGEGSNRDVMEQIVRRYPCRVGGGIRDVETAMKWLNMGAEQVIIGTAAKPELLEQLPKNRVIAALDAREGEVVVEGWKTGTGEQIQERMERLNAYVGGYLITFVEREGHMEGTDLDRVEPLINCAGDADVTVAGGITTPREVARLDELGADAQVGMALYTDELALGDAMAAPLASDREDGLWPTVVQDELGSVLGLVYSSPESLREAVREQRGIYHSRERGLWKKGETSGNVQELVRVDVDCDRDALRFVVRQEGDGFCHRDRWTCWGDEQGLPALFRTVLDRLDDAPEGSYTRKLLDDPSLLQEKLEEEVSELARATSREEAVHETADVLYFALVELARNGGGLPDVERELDRRSLRVTRRSEEDESTSDEQSGQGGM